MKKKRLRRYINSDQARFMTGLTNRALIYHAQRGNVRVIKQLQYGDYGHFRYLYHVDDIRALNWPSSFDIARSIGMDGNRLSTVICKYTIKGAVKIGGRLRFPPIVAKKVEQWALSGFPITEDIRLKKV